TRRRHHVVLVRRQDTADQLAVAGHARYDGPLAGAAGTDGLVADVEAELRLAGPVVGAVALEAVPRQDGPDLAVEEVLPGRRPQEGGRGKKEGQTQGRRAHGGSRGGGGGRAGAIVADAFRAATAKPVRHDGLANSRASSFSTGLYSWN